MLTCGRACVQRNLFHLMGWLDAQLFRRAAAMRYGGAPVAEPYSDLAQPYSDPGKDHWKKVLVRALSCNPIFE